MEQQNARFSAAVLAGGLSSRMGRDKAALPFDGTTLLDFQVGKLRALGVKDIMISGSEQKIPGARPISDVYPRKGPLSGIHACLAAAKGSAVHRTVSVALSPRVMAMAYVFSFKVMVYTP